MDPNANLAEQSAIIARNTGGPSWAPETGDRARLRDLRSALADWLGHGGFPPEWARYPRAARYYGK